MVRSVRERFEEKYIPEPNSGCWLWDGSLDSHGYGQLSSKRGSRPHRASVVSYELYKGGVPNGWCVLHRCDVPCCVNPDHLWLGTRKENSIDMVEKGRGRGQFV